MKEQCKVLKLTVNCLSLISFELRIRKKYKFSSSGDILHISAKLQGGYLQNVILTNRKIWRKG